ncbi:hypothetical protein FOZ63_009942, partial [Perkinsus olseni]
EHLSKEDKAKFLALADRLESESTRMSKDFGSFGTALSGLDAGAATTKAELAALTSEEGRLTAKMAAFSTRGQNVIAADKIYGTQLLGGLKSQTARYASESAGALGALALQEKNNASKSVAGYMSLMERRFGATRGALLREEAEARSQYGVEKNDVDKAEVFVATLKDESQKDEIKLRDSLLRLIRSDDQGAENFIREMLEAQDGRLVDVRNVLLKMIGTDSSGVVNATEADVSTVKDKMELLLASEETEAQKDARRDSQLIENTDK